MQLDRIGRPNKGWAYANRNKAKQEWIKYKFLLPKDQYEKLKKFKNMSERIRIYIEWGLENDDNKA